MNKKKLTIGILAILATVLLVSAIGGTSVLASDALTVCSDPIPQNLNEVTETLSVCISTYVKTFSVVVFLYMFKLAVLSFDAINITTTPEQAVFNLISIVQKTVLVIFLLVSAIAIGIANRKNVLGGQKMKKMTLFLISILLGGLIACSESNDIDVVATMQKAVAVETTNAEYYATGTAIANEIFELTPKPLPTYTPEPTFTPSENDETEIDEAQSGITEAPEGMVEVLETVATLAPTPTPTAEPTEIAPLRVFYPVDPDTLPYWLEKEIVDEETTRLTISDTIRIEVHTGNESGHLLPYGVTFEESEFVVDIQSYTEKLDIERFDHDNVYPEIKQGYVLTQTERVTFSLQEGAIVKLTNEEVWENELQENDPLTSVQVLFTVIQNQVVFVVPDFFYNSFEPAAPFWWWDESSLHINYNSPIHCEGICGTHHFVLDLIPYGEGSIISHNGIHDVNHDGNRLVYPRIDLTVDD